MRHDQTTRFTAVLPCVRCGVRVMHQQVADFDRITGFKTYAWKPMPPHKEPTLPTESKPPLTADSVRVFMANVDRRRNLEVAAYQRWRASFEVVQDNAVREKLWDEWVAARSTLDRAVLLLRGEMIDRARMEG